MICHGLKQFPFVKSWKLKVIFFSEFFRHHVTQSWTEYLIWKSI